MGGKGGGTEQGTGPPSGGGSGGFLQGAPAAALSSHAPGRPTAEVDVALEYQGGDGCWRSHTSTVLAPVRQPFRVMSKVGQGLSTAWSSMMGSHSIRTVHLQSFSAMPHCVALPPILSGGPPAEVPHILCPASPPACPPAMLRVPKLRTAFHNIMLPSILMQASHRSATSVLLSVSLAYQGMQPAVVQDIGLVPQDGCEVRVVGVRIGGYGFCTGALFQTSDNIKAGSKLREPAQHAPTCSCCGTATPRSDRAGTHCAQAPPCCITQVANTAAPPLPATMHPGTELALSFVLATTAAPTPSNPAGLYSSSSSSSSSRSRSSSSSSSSSSTTTIATTTSPHPSPSPSVLPPAPAARAMASHFGVEQCKLSVAYCVAADAQHAASAQEVVPHGRAPLWPPRVAGGQLQQQQQQQQQQHKRQPHEQRGGGWQLPLPPVLVTASTAPGVSEQASSSETFGAAQQQQHAPVSHTFRWGLRLEGMGSQGATPQSCERLGPVAVRLLGPLACRAGQPVALAWQLTRLQGGGSPVAGPGSCAGGSSNSNGSGSSGTEQQQQQQQQQEAGPSPPCTTDSDASELLAYDVTQPGGVLPPPQQQQQQLWGLAAASGRGVVRLGGQRGAVAVVEVVVEPLMVGQLLPPRLVVRRAPQGSQEQQQGELQRIAVFG